MGWRANEAQIQRLSELGQEFSPSEHATWRAFHGEFHALMAKHADNLHPFYAQNLEVLKPFADAIPSLADIQALLAPIGWTARYVDGYVQPWLIARLLARRVMPVSRTIRPADQLFFADEPDLIHDIFGHLPSLLHAEYRQLLWQWADVASRVEITAVDQAQYYLNKLLVQNQSQDQSADKVAAERFAQLTTAVSALGQYSDLEPSAMQILDKVYFWLFEFGMIASRGKKRIFGAGILSSLSELAKLGTSPAAVEDLSLATVLSPYNISRQQARYLAARSEQDFSALLAAATRRTLVHARRLGRSYAH